MASLPTLALGTYTNISSTAIQGSDPVLEVIASLDDADYVYDATNSTHTGEASFALDNMPSDFSSMLTLAVRLRYHWATGTQTNSWDTLRARVFKSDGTTALTDLVTVASAITTTTATNSSVISFTGVSTTATKADWDGAVVRIYFYITKSKTGDTVQKRVTAGELTGTYTAGTSYSGTPGSGSVSYTGVAPSVKTPRNMLPGSGVLTYTGKAPTAVLALVGTRYAENDTIRLAENGIRRLVESAVSSSVNAAPGTGVITYTGKVPTVQTPRVMRPGVGAVTYTGIAPSVQTPRTIRPGVGAVTYTGVAPAVKTPRNMAPGSGTVTLTGVAPTVQTPRNVRPSAGVVTYTGIAPTIQTPRNIRAATGVVTYTGKVPVVTTPLAVFPLSGTVTFAGFAPAVVATANVKVSPVSGTVTYTGVVPTIQTPRAMTPGTGAVTLTGYAPVVAASSNVTMHPTTGAVTFDGVAPTVSIATMFSLIPGTGEVTYTGYAPLTTLGVSGGNGSGFVSFGARRKKNKDSLWDMRGIVAPYLVKQIREEEAAQRQQQAELVGMLWSAWEELDE